MGKFSHFREHMRSDGSPPETKSEGSEIVNTELSLGGRDLSTGFLRALNFYAVCKQGREGSVAL